MDQSGSIEFTCCEQHCFLHMGKRCNQQAICHPELSHQPTIEFKVAAEVLENLFILVLWIKVKYRTLNQTLWERLKT